jgi:CubicO group peptidase (beta-lactamase class C family)
MSPTRRTFIKQVGLGAVGISMMSALPESVLAQEIVRRHLPRSTPEAQGVSSAKILAFLDAVAKSDSEFHSFMLIRHGYVVAEGWWSPYAADLNHMLYSLSKSFTSTAIGFAVSEGRLTVNDPVISFFPDKLPATVSDNLAALKVKHLLTMSAGHAKDSSHDIQVTDDWVRNFLAYPIANPPGSVFLYNSGESYMLSAIVQKVTGQKVIDYLRPRLFDPLDFIGMTWETCPLGINTGGWGLAITTEEIAKFGLFYLHKGMWNGKQLLPVAWVEEATTFKIQQPPSPGQTLEDAKKNSEWHQGYCYQFWRTRHNAFRGDGAMGQYCIVMPDQDAIIAVTGESGDMAGEFELFWKYLLPAMKDAPLPGDPAAEGQLQQRLASLALLPPMAQPTSPIVAQVSGKKYEIMGNPEVASVSFRFHGDKCKFTLTDAQGDHSITCGIGKWVEGISDMPGTPPKVSINPLSSIQKVKASGTWLDANTFQMTWRFYETPHHDTVTCHFDGLRVRVVYLNSVTEKKFPDHDETRLPLDGLMMG